jgi:hypothetical protein
MKQPATSPTIICVTNTVCASVQDALRALEMPRFTRRYPVVLETLMKQMLAMVHVSGTGVTAGNAT